MIYNKKYVFGLGFVPAAAAAAAKSLQSFPTLCNPIDGSPPGSPVPDKNTGVRCHFPLQCMKVKSKSEVAQSCPTLHDPMDCSLPGSSAHGIFQARDHAFLHQWVHGRLPEAELHFSLTCNKGLQQRLPLSCFTLRPL